MLQVRCTDMCVHVYCNTGTNQVHSLKVQYLVYCSASLFMMAVCINIYTLLSNMYSKIYSNIVDYSSIQNHHFQLWVDIIVYTQCYEYGHTYIKLIFTINELIEYSEHTVHAWVQVLREKSPTEHVNNFARHTFSISMMHDASLALLTIGPFNFNDCMNSSGNTFSDMQLCFHISGRVHTCALAIVVTCCHNSQYSGQHITLKTPEWLGCSHMLGCVHTSQGSWQFLDISAVFSCFHHYWWRQLKAIEMSKELLWTLASVNESKHKYIYNKYTIL